MLKTIMSTNYVNKKYADNLMNKVRYLDSLEDDVTHLNIKITLPPVSKLIGLFGHLDKMAKEEFQNQILSLSIEGFHFLFKINITL